MVTQISHQKPDWLPTKFQQNHIVAAESNDNILYHQVLEMVKPRQYFYWLDRHAIQQ